MKLRWVSMLWKRSHWQISPFLKCIQCMQRRICHTTFITVWLNVVVWSPSTLRTKAEKDHGTINQQWLGVLSLFKLLKPYRLEHTVTIYGIYARSKIRDKGLGDEVEIYAGGNLLKVFLLSIFKVALVLIYSVKLSPSNREQVIIVYLPIIPFGRGA